MLSLEPAEPLPFHGVESDRACAAQIAALVQSAQTVVITGHERPDGDCIGSEVALCSILRAQNKMCEIVNADPTPARYAYLDDGTMLRLAGDGALALSDGRTPDLVFVLDSTDLSRIGRVAKMPFGAAQIVDIDHHLGNPNFGAVNFIDVAASSAAELIARLASAMQWPVPLLGRVALYTGISTDTGQFSYSNTTPAALRIAADLRERGVDCERIWRTVYLNKTAAELALEARARASLEVHAGGRLALVSIRSRDFAETNTTPQNAEDFPNIPRYLTGVELAVYGYEINGGQSTKFSLRSTPAVDVDALAKRFGGGGHRQAAGCTLSGALDATKAQFLAAAERHLADSGA